MNSNQIKLAVKPPAYFPRLSYVALMQSVDVFVVADTFQYSRQSYQNRARIRTPQGWHWVSVPLEGRQHGRPICETKIDNRSHWRSKHMRSISFNYSQTPFYGFIESAIHGLYEKEWEVLADLCYQTISLLHEMMALNCRLVRASELEGCPGSLKEVLEVMPPNKLITDHALEASHADGEVPCQVLDFKEPVYRQHFEGFEPEITALDLLCNYGPEATGVLRSGITSARSDSSS